MNFICCNKVEKDIHSYVEHSHTNWEIIYQLSGNVDCIIDGKTIPMSKNDVLIVPPNISHKGVAHSTFKDISFSARHLDFHHTKPKLIHDYDGSVRTLINLLYKLGLEKNASYEQAADSLIQTIVFFLKKNDKKRYMHEFLHIIENSIYENLSNADFSISYLCKKLGYNMDYVRRCFKSEFGETPLEYITNLRLKNAKNLLEQEFFHSMQEISAECGFNDYFYFSKVFKSKYSLSPRDYRKKVFSENNQKRIDKIKRI